AVGVVAVTVVVAVAAIASIAAVSAVTTVAAVTTVTAVGRVGSDRGGLQQPDAEVHDTAGLRIGAALDVVPVEATGNVRAGEHLQPERRGLGADCPVLNLLLELADGQLDQRE